MTKLLFLGHLNIV